MAFLDTILGLAAVFFRSPCWQISYLQAKLQSCDALAIHWPSQDSKHALHCNLNIWSRGNYGIVNDLFKNEGSRSFFVIKDGYQKNVNCHSQCKAKCKQIFLWQKGLVGQHLAGSTFNLSCQSLIHSDSIGLRNKSYSRWPELPMVSNLHIAWFLLST